MHCSVECFLKRIYNVSNVSNVSVSNCWSCPLVAWRSSQWLSANFRI